MPGIADGVRYYAGFLLAPVKANAESADIAADLVNQSIQVSWDRMRSNNSLFAQLPDYQFDYRSNLFKGGQTAWHEGQLGNYLFDIYYNLSNLNFPNRWQAFKKGWDTGNWKDFQEGEGENLFWTLFAKLTTGPSNCFSAGTPVLTPEGAKAIELFRAGDFVLSRSEHDVGGAIEVKVVEETFVRVAPVLNLRVLAQDIRTTAQHPFYVRNKGWRCAGEITSGEELLSHDGRWVTVDAVSNHGDVTTVYNLRIADYHTYFVGCDEWGFSVWAHRSATCAEQVRLALEAEGIKIPAGDARLQTIADHINAGNAKAARAELQKAGLGGGKANSVIDVLENPPVKGAPAPAGPAVPARPAVPDSTIQEIARHVVEDPHPQAQLPRYPGQTQAQVQARIRGVIANADPAQFTSELTGRRFCIMW